MNLPYISISEIDYERLMKLLEHESNKDLSDELERAEIIDVYDVTSSLVTMDSLVVYKDHSTNQIHESLLVYSQCPDEQEVCISVQSSLGTALLGLQVGQRITWKIDNKFKTIEVLNVLSMP